MADNNYCACNSGESRYTIKLNQQGPTGKKGEQGDKGIPGFSPFISVAQSDDDNYILRINNEANSYNTPNLFPKEQLATWTNNIEAKVQQNTTDISNINGHYVDLETRQTIYGVKAFMNSINVGFTDLPNVGEGIRLTHGTSIAAIQFVTAQSSGGYHQGVQLLAKGFYDPTSSPMAARLYYSPNILFTGGIKENVSSADELAVKGDLPKVATTTTAGIVKPDGTTVTINTDGVISAVGEVSQQELADGLALKVNITDYNNRVGSLESTVGEQAQTIATLQENNTRLLEMINALKDRVTALETMIDGGNA